MVNVLIALFVVYVLVTVWQMRRAVQASDPQQRLTEARRLLFTTSLGLPILIGLILVA